MGSFAMTVPFARTSPLHIPRRDLVLAASDSVAMRITVVDTDTASGQPVLITGGLGGPGAQLIVWADSYYRNSWGFGGWGYDYRNSWDYGAFPQWPPDPVWVGNGTPIVGAGAFDFSFPSGTMAAWPRRCGWCVQLTYDTQSAEVLMSGRLHLQKTGARSFQLMTPGLETDDYIPVHTDTDEQVLV